VSRQESHRPRAGRVVYSLGTCCGTLAVAAVVSAVYPVPEPVARSGDAPAAAPDDVLSTLTDVWFPVDGSAPVGGPLEPPTIGVGLLEFDDQMEALEAAREAPRSPVRTEGRRPPAPARSEQPAPGELPGRPPDPPELPPVVREPTPSPTPPATETPAAPATPAPTTPPPALPTTPTPTTPTTPPPVEEPPEEPPPLVEEPPEEPPPPPPPDDTTLALGERYDHVDSAGTVLFSVTLVRIDTALACTAPGSVPAENGHLIGLHVEVVVPGPPADGGPPPVGAADFRFLGADDVLTADVDTDSSAACLEDGRPGPDAPGGGTVVLDVPAVTGTVVYRPASWPAGLRWGVPPAE